MLTSSCDKCGSSVRLQLANQGAYRCVYCKHQGHVNAGVVSELDEAAKALDRLDASKRQLTSEQQRLLAMGGSHAQSMVTAFLLIAGFWLVSAIYGAVAQFQSGVWVAMVSGVFILIPSLLFAVVVAVGSFRLFQKKRALELVSSAMPPEIPGGQAACRVCSGPVGTPGNQAIVRCDWCKTDNLVSPQVIFKVRDHVKEKGESFLDEVVQHAQQLSAATYRFSFRSWLVMMGVSILMSVLGFAMSYIVTFLGVIIEISPNQIYP